MRRRGPEARLAAGGDIGRLAYERHRGEAELSVSREAICTWIYAQPKGELEKRGMVLRTGASSASRAGGRRRAVPGLPG
jgi:hypothetical protein